MITRTDPVILDGMNRLTDAVYGEGNGMNNNANRYTERIRQYNDNGSPLQLERYGRLDNGTFGKVDDLTLAYNGNRLLSVSDAAPAIHYNGAFDFRDGASIQTEYTYDGCGSLTSDANKGIAHIDYDLTGMPRRIQFTNGNVTEYVYSPAGEKLRTVRRTAVADLNVPIGSTMELTTATTLSVETSDYIGNLILRNGKPDLYLFNGGYCSYPANPVASSQPTFHYYTKDHLGNNRTVVNENGILEQVTHYYPFGGIFGDATLNAGTQPYEYNGKELDHVHGLNWYDYGARQYDPILARWDRIDPLAEKYYHISPYAYCAGDPVNAVDSDGRAINLLTGAIGAIAGAGINASIAFWESKSSEEIWGAAVEGAIVGGVAGLTLGASVAIAGSTTLGEVTVGALSSAAGNAANQLISQGEIKGDELFCSTIVGGVSGPLSAKGGKFVDKCGDMAVETIKSETANTIANARNLAYSQVEQTGAQMGGKYAKQQVNKETSRIIAKANSDESSAIQATKAITAGKNWSVQTGIGTIASKVSGSFDSAKEKVKSVFKKLF